MDRELGTEGIAEFKALEFRDIAALHFGPGLAIRNNWGLWSGSALQRRLRARGFAHPDDMSEALLKSYWLRLHGYPQRLREQAGWSRGYWRAYRVYDRRRGSRLVCIRVRPDPFGPDELPDYKAPRYELRCVQRVNACEAMWTQPVGTSPRTPPDVLEECATSG